MTRYLMAVGTKKGLFLATSTDRVDWSWSDPHLGMQAVAGVGIDTRRDPVRLLAGAHSQHWGPVVVRSDDLGETWTELERGAVRFPADLGASVEQVWQLQPGPAERPEEVWAGVEPAALFRSVDGGESFELVRGLWDHPHRPQWNPGAGGMCLHTVLPHPRDPDRLLVAISAGGVYRSEDGGSSWSASNTGIEARFMPDRYPEFGQCVHKVARFADDPDHLVAQNHGGVFTSTDDGRTWSLATAGLPADFGFGVATHPRRAGTAYLVPLVADAHRLPPDGQLQVWRTGDGASSWAAASAGLPDHCWTISLRDALTTDGADPLGIYVGTRGGEVWVSADEGEGWTLAGQRMPDVLCVRAAALP
ncbi:MAG TPA: exo-alpha-sialidase [Actinomycetes bacterium]|nr:exo-alpha-sialidase [Actinomycetes bacterium]